jgi:hypothetical protein
MLERTSVQGPLTLGQQQEWNTSFSGATAQGGRAQPGQIQRERQSDAQAAVAAAAEADKAEAAKKSADALELLGKGAILTATAFKTVDAVLSSLAERQRASAMSLAERRTRLSGALGDLGYDPKEAAGIMKSAESGTGKLTADQVLQLYEAGAVGAGPLAGQEFVRDQIDATVRQTAAGSMSFARGLRNLSSGPLPSVTGQIQRNMGARGLEGGGRDAMGFTSNLSQADVRTDAEIQANARARAESEAAFDRDAKRDVLGAATRTFGFTGIYSWAAGAETPDGEGAPAGSSDRSLFAAMQESIRAQRETAKNTRPGPPSTNAGRSGPLP